MKKRFCLILALLVITALAGCSGFRQFGRSERMQGFRREIFKKRINCLRKKAMTLLSR